MAASQTKITDTLGDSRVSLVETPMGYEVRNQFIAAQLEKRSGRLVALEFAGKNLLGKKRDKVSGGYWSLAPSIDSRHARYSIVEMPQAGQGKRCILSFQKAYTGEDNVPLDVDIRYAILADESAVYCWAILNHPKEYPLLVLSLGRFALKLDPHIFNYLAVDGRRNGEMPTSEDWIHGEELNLKEARRLRTGRFAGKVEHKYDYSAVLFETRAYGWASTHDRKGVWIINPATEYLSGGPTKVELTGHLGTGNVARPTLVNVWHGPHYGGEPIRIAAGEEWSKIIGPFLIYCNAGKPPRSLWRQALRQANSASLGWPFSWAAPEANGRGTVAGLIVVHESTKTARKPRNFRVGLTAKDTWYSTPTGRTARVDWQLDGKHYQYWQKAEATGAFVIPHVRPGRYELRAIADNVLGEFVCSDIDVRSGERVELGKMVWTPLRFGAQVWEIGYPNRTADKFRHGADYWHWGFPALYDKEFPEDLHYRVENGDWETGWNFVQPTRVKGGKIVPTTWRISFRLDDLPQKGQAFLRIAIAGARARRGIFVEVNNQQIRGTGPLRDSGVIHRDGIRGYWCEKVLRFNVSRLQLGENCISLHVPARNWTDGVLYDYLRLEVLARRPARNPQG